MCQRANAARSRQRKPTTPATATATAAALSQQRSQRRQQRRTAEALALRLQLQQRLAQGRQLLCGGGGIAGSGRGLGCPQQALLRQQRCRGRPPAPAARASAARGGRWHVFYSVFFYG